MIPCHHIQVAVSIHIAQRDCMSVINIRTYVCTAYQEKRYFTAII